MKPLLLNVLLLCLFIAPATAQSSLNFEILDGKTNTSILQMDASQKTTNANGISVQQTYSPAQDTQPELAIFSIKNSSTSDRWLLLNWNVVWNSNHNSDQVFYWSGQGEPVTGAALLENPGTDASSNTSMLQAIYDKKDGIALALPPDQIVSDIHQSLKSKDGNFILHLQVPLVLNAGQSDEFPIEVYHFTPRYGFLDALQKYFLAHPEDFNPRRNIDPRAAGVSGSRPWLDLYANHPIAAFEKNRRFRGDWEWFYAPFRRTGDIYTRDEFWDFQPARPFNKSRSEPSAEIYRQKRHDALQEIDKAGAVAAFYVPSYLYAEEQLAQEQYPDAIIRKPDGTMWRHYTTPWVTYSDNEILMYPWGNKFALQTQKDLQQLVKENDIHAFGYDIMAGSARFRGKGMRQSPRRAFDKDGEYVDSAVAIAMMQDFQRNLEKDGRKVGVVGNATNESRPFLVARSDSLMSEQPAYYYPEELTALRYAAGHKLITIWSSWRLPDLLKTDEMTPDELRIAYKAAAEYTRLAAYRYGAYPSSRWSDGVPEITHMLPLLKNVISQGWQAVPATRGADENLPSTIWPARYGNDIGSFVTLGNAQRSAWNGKIIIDNDYLGSTNYLFAALSGGKVLSQTVKARTTILHVEIPARETLVLRAIANIPANTSLAATVNWSDDGASGTLTIKSTFTPIKVLSPHDGWKLVNQKDDKWNFESLYFASPAADLRDFPFFDTASTAQIVLPKDATPDQQTAAQRIQDYFRFWGNEAMNRAKELILPIVQSKTADATKPHIVISGNIQKVHRDGQTLTLSGGDLQQATLQFLALLDKKYFYTGTLPTTGRDAEALKRAELAGKQLPSDLATVN